jgi:RNA polymerase sigma-70 factor (ECF subfamily)
MTTSWLQQAKAGDDVAWERLDRVYRRLILWWCLKSGIPRRDTEDITQEVFIAVQRGLPNYLNESFRGWLWTITKARIKDYWRIQEKQPITHDGCRIDEILDEVEVESGRNVGSVDQATKVLFDEIVSMVKGESTKRTGKHFG